MCRFRCAIFAAVLVVAVAPSAHSLDLSHVTCHEFMASGRANMAAIIMFLHGYHAGRTGVIRFTETDNTKWGARLGFYCKQYPNANLIEASEQILKDIDRGL
jgi:HdeA/HdeB family